MTTTAQTSTQTPSQTHRKASPVDFDLLTEVLPSKMIAARRWLVWKYVPNGSKKPKKVPYYANGQPRGKTDTPRDLNSLTMLQEVREAIETNPEWAGIGFALGKDGDGFWQGIDLDKIHENGLNELAKTLPSYVERSPSGEGVHAIGYGTSFAALGSTGDGLEAYSDKRYFTVTGKVLIGDELCDLAGFVSKELAPLRAKNDLAFTQEEHKRSPPTYTRDTRDTRITRTQDTQARKGGPTTSKIEPLPAETLRLLMPRGEGHRNTKVFELARYCKGKYPKADREELKPIVQQWHESALPLIGTKEFGETWADFCVSMANVKFPKGAQLEEIMERVEIPTSVPPEHGELSLVGYHLLLICTALQAIHGEEPFFLGYRTAGYLIGRHFTDAGKLLKFLVMEGYLREVSKGNQSGRTASTYLLLRSA